MNLEKMKSKSDRLGFVFTDSAPNKYGFQKGDILVIDPTSIPFNGLVAVKFPRNDIAELREVIRKNSLWYWDLFRTYLPIKDGIPIIYEDENTPESERGHIIGGVIQLIRSLEDVYTENKEESKHEKTRLYLE